MVKIKFTLLCHDLQIDPKTGEYSIIRVFDTFTAPQVPVRFKMLVWWSGKVGESFTTFFTITDEQGKVLVKMRPTRQTISAAPVNVTRVDFDNIIFPHAGRYAANIHKDSSLIQSVPFTVEIAIGANVN